MLPPEAMLALLNAYFEGLTNAIEAKGGEVLKSDKVPTSD